MPKIIKVKMPGSHSTVIAKLDSASNWTDPRLKFGVVPNSDFTPSLSIPVNISLAPDTGATPDSTLALQPTIFPESTTPPKTEFTFSFRTNVVPAPSPPPNLSGLVPSTVNHPTWFLSIVVLQIENSLFRVPRQYFKRNGSVFVDMFSISESFPGDSMGKPILIPGVTTAEFECFLTALLGHPAGNAIDMDQTQWMSVLKLGTMWEFEELRRKAMKSIGSLNETSLKGGRAEKFEQGDKLRVPTWCLEVCVELLHQESPPSKAEAAALGMTRLLLVCQARETFFKRFSTPWPVKDCSKHGGTCCERVSRFSGGEFSLAVQVVRETLTEYKGVEISRSEWLKTTA